MSARFLLCNVCDGRKVDEAGNKCLDCSGLGGSVFGEDRPLDVIEGCITSAQIILALDRREHARAAEAVREASKEKLNGIYLQLTMIEESIVFWEAMLSAYEKELADHYEREKNALIRQSPA